MWKYSSSRITRSKVISFKISTLFTAILFRVLQLYSFVLSIYVLVCMCVCVRVQCIYSYAILLQI